MKNTEWFLGGFANLIIAILISHNDDDGGGISGVQLVGSLCVLAIAIYCVIKGCQ